MWAARAHPTGTGRHDITGHGGRHSGPNGNGPPPVTGGQKRGHFELPVALPKGVANSLKMTTVVAFCACHTTTESTKNRVHEPSASY